MAEAHLHALRQRLIASNLVMRYDYAWKEMEFSQFEHGRMSGVILRLLYLHAFWMYQEEKHSTKAKQEVGVKVFVDANGYQAFEQSVEKACQVCGYQIVKDPKDRLKANLFFIYIPPQGEVQHQQQIEKYQRHPFENVQTTVKELQVHDESITTPGSSNTDTNSLPIVCCLLGDCEFLEEPIDKEVERLRGLSGFAISQQLTSVLEEIKYSAIGHFAVEFTPSFATEKMLPTINGLMKKFGCTDRNLMNFSEKWEIFASNTSPLVTLQQVTAEEETFWVDFSKGKTCDQCHAIHEKLFKCSRCNGALYCSRECQKTAWKLHKAVCIINKPN